MYGFDPTDFKFVRHAYMEINPLDLYRNNPSKFDSYQSFQRTKHSKNYDGVNFIAVFAPFHSTQAILLGVWQVLDKLPSNKAPKNRLLDVKEFKWNLKLSSYYKLKKVAEFDELSERLVIEWGKGTVSWIQRRDKEVMALLQKTQIGEFVSYEKTILNWEELSQIAENPRGNYTWTNALKAVNGIYCITNVKDGRNYVGSAYGKNGIWGRWLNYTKTGHGNNKQLIELVQKRPKTVEQFQFSILEILPGSSTADDAIEKENLWKMKLSAKIGGYNSN